MDGAHRILHHAGILFNALSSILNAIENHGTLNDDLLKSLKADQDPVAVSLCRWLQSHSPGDYGAVIAAVETLTDRCHSLQDVLKTAPQGPERDLLLKNWREQIRIAQNVNQRMKKLEDIGGTPKLENDADNDRVRLELQQMQQKAANAPSAEVSDCVIEVIDKHEAVKRIQQDAADLAEIYQDMKYLTNKQRDILQEIEKNTAKIADRTKKGTEALQKAEQRSQRRPCCGWRAVFVAFLIMTPIVIVLVLLKPR